MEQTEFCSWAKEMPKNGMLMFYYNIETARAHLFAPHKQQVVIDSVIDRPTHASRLIGM